MSGHKALSGLMEHVNAWIFKAAMWFVLAATLVGARSAIVRKAFDASSEALLDAPWYPLAGVLMVGAGYALLKVARGRHWVDMLGALLVLLSFICIYLSWPS
jgi:TRAP-type mannitol/chloroaromatic compound transport system permease small subunit